MLPDGFELRHATFDDAAAVAELARACESEVLGVEVISEGDVRDWWRLAEPAENVWLVHEEGRLAAAATIWLQGTPNVWGDVHPELTGRGLGSALLELAETRAREGGNAAIRNDVFAQDERATALLESRGYRLVRRYWEMRIELGDEPPAVEWPDGIEVRAFELDDAEAFHAALGEAFGEEWGHASMSFEEWRRARIEADDFERELWAVAWDGDDIAGVVRNEPFRYGGGWIGALGVRKAYRRRGLGLALLQHSFGLFHERGQRSVGLGVDSENPTGATRLYERAGMAIESQTVSFEKSLA